MRLINRVLFGGSYKVTHWDSKGKGKVFWCDTWQDAIEWVSCGLNCDKITVSNTTGQILATRNP